MSTKNITIKQNGKQVKVDGEINIQEVKKESKEYRISYAKIVEEKIQEGEITFTARQVRTLAEAESIFPLFMALKESGILDGKISNRDIAGLVSSRNSFEMALAQLSTIDESYIKDISFVDIAIVCLDIFSKDTILQDMFAVWAKKVMGAKVM